MRLQLEQRLQRQVAEYLSWSLIPPAWFTSFPAGGGGELRGKIAKGMGLKAGVADLLIIDRGRPFWIELKSPRGTLSEAQRRTADALIAAGCRWTVARSFDDVRGALWGWGIPLRDQKPMPAVIRSLAADLATAEPPYPSPAAISNEQATAGRLSASRIEAIANRARSEPTRRSTRSRRKGM